MPEQHDRQLIIMVDPPYWPGKSQAFSFMQKGLRDFWACWLRGHGLYWLRKTAHNSLYLLGDIRRAVFISRQARQHNFHEAIMSSRAAIIRNRHDRFCTPGIASLLAGEGKFSFYTLPGEHDDLWLYRRRHVRLIDKIVRSHPA